MELNLTKNEILKKIFLSKTSPEVKLTNNMQKKGITLYNSDGNYPKFNETIELIRFSVSFSELLEISDKLIDFNKTRKSKIIINYDYSDTDN